MRWEVNTPPAIKYRLSNTLAGIPLPIHMRLTSDNLYGIYCPSGDFSASGLS
jgi:hypothetical protein